MGFSLGMYHWFFYILINPLVNPLSSAWILVLLTLAGAFGRYIREIRLNKEEKHKLKHLLRNKGLEFEVSNPIPPENLTPLIHRLYQETEYYLDKERPGYPIRYYPETNVFKIFYDGKLKSEVQILKIVVKNFNREFSIKALV